jgi:hypothetical protein
VDDNRTRLELHSGWGYTHNLTSIVDALPGEASYHLLPFGCHLILDVDTKVGEAGMLLSNLLHEALAAWLLAGKQTVIDEVGGEQLL